MIKQIGAVMALAGFVGLCYGVDSRYAHQPALAASEARIRTVEDRVRLRELGPVVWRLEALYEKKPMPKEVKAEYDRVKAEKEAIERKLGIR
jgi:hypothetical protein